MRDSKMVDTDGKRVGEVLGVIRGRKNYNQDIVCGGKSIFHKRKKSLIILKFNMNS